MGPNAHCKLSMHKTHYRVRDWYDPHCVRTDWAGGATTPLSTIHNHPPTTDNAPAQHHFAGPGVRRSAGDTLDTRDATAPGTANAPAPPRTGSGNGSGACDHDGRNVTMTSGGGTGSRVERGGGIDGSGGSGGRGSTAGGIGRGGTNGGANDGGGDGGDGDGEITLRTGARTMPHLDSVEQRRRNPIAQLRAALVRAVSGVMD